MLGHWTWVGGRSPVTLLVGFPGFQSPPFHRQLRRPRLGVGRLLTRVSEVRNAGRGACLQNLCLPRPAAPQHTHTHTHTHSDPA